MRPLDTKRPVATPGVFIVLEGTDGSGKGTQFKLLAERLRAIGHDVETVDFPRYDQLSSYFVKEYLNGRYGPAVEISPYVASLFFALDRYNAAPAIVKALSEGRIVLANRYAGSNMAHQGSKFRRSGERRAFFLWADKLEYEVLAIPRPNLNLCLRLPAEIAYELVGQKADRRYTDQKRDQHEADINHLRRSVTAYDQLCQLFPRDWQTINCTASGQLKSVTAINELIWSAIQPLLPPATKPARPLTVSLKPKNQPLEAARLSRPDSRRYSGLALLHLINSGLAVQAAKPLSSVFSPQLSRKTADHYHGLMARQNKLRQQLSAELKKSSSAAGKGLALALSWPLARLEDSHVETGQLAKLRGFDLAELRPTNPASQSRRSEPELPSVTGLTRRLSADAETVYLLKAEPRREADILLARLFEVSQLSLNELDQAIDHWTYKQKRSQLQRLIRQTDSLEDVRYEWQLLIDWHLLRQLLESGLVTNVSWQAPSPRFGYEMPAEVEKAGLDGLYTKLFDLSLELYSQLQADGAVTEAAYAVMWGHKGRCRLVISAQALLELKRRPLARQANAAQLLADMEQAISQHHPLIADWLASGPLESKLRANTNRQTSHIGPNR
ncbi:hypothetical protein HY380_02440 [Candidatus Saccharibacteria bacterium]|nr:hypothetical protein [Candidatus Saccharibacteria bacterium]